MGASDYTKSIITSLEFLLDAKGPRRVWFTEGSEGNAGLRQKGYGSVGACANWG